MVEGTQAGLSCRGSYELRDGTCEKCGVKFEIIDGKLVCPVCGGDIGRLKQTGVLKPRGKI